MSRIFNKVFLVGYMGSGKSHFGEILAKKLNFTFIDTDSYIENMSGKCISSIFSDHGEAFFRNLETEAVKAISLQNKIVVATGGGLPCFNNNLDFLKNNGIVIFLDTDLNLLIMRLLNEKLHRPIISEMQDSEQLKSFIEDHINKRLPYYGAAHLSIEILNDDLGFMDDLVRYLKQILDYS